MGKPVVFLAHMFRDVTPVQRILQMILALEN